MPDANNGGSEPPVIAEDQRSITTDLIGLILMVCGSILGPVALALWVRNPWAGATFACLELIVAGFLLGVSD